MPDFLTRRHGTWHFVRRVPLEFSAVDPRGIVKHTTKVRIADDRNGRRAVRVAAKFNLELEAQWRSLAGGKLRPQGFPRYREKSSGLSGTMNKYLKENGLRPLRGNTLYSLRHSFKDRLVTAEASDSLIDNLMGHRTGKSKYGRGPTLDHKLKFLKGIAFTVPDGL